MGAHRVLVVEDDHSLRDLIARGLRAQDLEVVTARDGASAVRSLSPPPDAIVLDISLPDSDGRDVCQAIRASGVDAPVIFLTARREVGDRLAAFASGADDYLPKPFAFAELVARLRALLRRHAQRVPADTGSRLVIDPLSHAVRLGERQIELSPIEYRLLARLLTDVSSLVRRRELREAGWPAGGIVSDNTLDQYVRKLRAKLAALDAPHLIRVARGVGYQVISPE